ncbi:YozE family protein [Lactococcus kimchii]|uniref:YozE family protein n=1 Tax=Lactococcus sp. S-13 TaxID=2507158 RepID=UPI0010233973|nr:YozE family protein [Lactococcus sp. S-13]RZI49162.1 YozE family protein [Lactococcus sp. S-13]
MTEPFYRFLMRHKSPVEIDDVTRLANLAFRDTLFPKQAVDFDEVSNYLETHAPFYFNLTLFDDIWQQYLES